MPKLKTRLAAVAAAAALSLALAASASAQTQQEGLVNVNIEDVTVQVPVSVAANLCDVSAAMLVNRFSDAPARCDATAESIATSGGGNGGGGTQQEGLVNVNVSGITIQAPISVAANICDVSVAILVNRFADAPARCTATAESLATHGSGRQNQ